MPAPAHPEHPSADHVIPDFRRDASAASADASLRRCLAIRDRAQHGAVLWFADILARGLYRELGFSSMNQYAQMKLGFSRARTSDFMALARKLDRLPAVKRELAAGRIGYTKAREIVSVADAGTEQAWLQEARTTPRRRLEQRVKEARRRARAARHADPHQGELLPAAPPEGPPAAVPVRIGFEMDPVQHARYEALLARLPRRGGAPAELLLRALEALVAQETAGVRRAGVEPGEANAAPGQPMTANDQATGAPLDSPRGESEPCVQIHVQDCPRCRRATVATPRGERELSATERAMAYEDALVQSPGRPNRSTIPPRMRREVLARDRFTCRRLGCGHTRELHLHHVTPRAKGGANSTENLITLCGACHRLLHERWGGLEGLLRPVGSGTS